MTTKSISSEFVTLEEALSNQNSSGKPIKTFVGVNCGNKIFTIHMSLFDLMQFTEVANDQSKNSSGVSQRSLNLPHATSLAKYILKGLLGAARRKRLNQGVEASENEKINEIINTVGNQPYFSIAPIVASFRNCKPNGTNLRVITLTTIDSETIAYKIFLNQGDTLWIVDGQHRRKAAEIVLDFLKHVTTFHKYPSKASLFPSTNKEELSSDELAVWVDCLEALKYCTVTLDVHLGLELDQEKQLFHDLNNLTKKVEKSLAFQFDSSNPINQFIKNVLVDDKFDSANFDVQEKDQSDWGKGGLSRKELVAINAILLLNKTNINGALPAIIDSRVAGAEKYWDTVLNLPGITSENSKLTTVAAQPVLLKAIAKLYFDFFFGRNEELKTKENQRKLTEDILNVDFSHTNAMWRFYTFTDEEKINEGLVELKEYLPTDDEGKNRDLGAFDPNAKTFRFGAKHNDIYPIIADMIRWKLGLPSRKK